MLESARSPTLEKSNAIVVPQLGSWESVTQAMLGVGIRREKKNLGTAAELLSKEAFDGGLRQNTDPWVGDLSFGSRTLPKTKMASWKIPIFMLGFLGG